MADPIFTLADIDRVAELASLDLTEEERQTFVAQFAELLTYFRKIDAAPVQEVHDHPPDAADHLRDDEPRASGTDPGSFSDHLEDGHFKVPKVIE